MDLIPLTFAEDRHEALWGVERWLVSAHSSAPSIVADGPYAGRRLDELVATFGAALTGTRAPERFPVLIKDIVARRRLSVQVHPSEATVSQTGGEPKTEMWRVLEVEPDSALWVGVRPGTTREDLARAIADGHVETLLLRQMARVGDIHYLPGGMIHCLGDGVRVFEVQQSSNTTFRLYDWGRTDAAGHARPLQVREALMAAEPTLSPQVARNAMHCPFFRMDAREVTSALDCPARPETFRVLFAEKGGFTVESAAGRQDVPEGRTVLLPAAVAARIVPSAPVVRLVAVSLAE